MPPDPITRPLVEGPAASIHLASTKLGKQPAADFLHDLDDRTLAKLQVLMQLRADNQRIHNEKQFRKLDDHIWEFKAKQARLFCFQEGPRLFLTNGYIKKTQRTNPAEITKANKVRTEFLKKLEKRDDD